MTNFRSDNALLRNTYVVDRLQIGYPQKYPILERTYKIGEHLKQKLVSEFY
jgi:hypothetical protein